MRSGMHAAGDGQTELGLGVVDGVAAHHRHLRLHADLRRPAQDAVEDVESQGARRKPHDVESHEGVAPMA